MVTLRTIWVGLLLFILLGALSIAVAQSEQTCPALAQRGLEQLDRFCSDLDRNSACYGSTLVEASFTQPVAPDFFTHPADKAVLTTMQTIRTSALDLTQDQWGVALMKVQADVPNSIPGQAVVFLLMGAARVENGVAPQDALILPEPVAARAAADLDLYAQPDPGSERIGAAGAGSEFLADAVSGDGLWVRVAYDERPAWVLIVSLVDTPDIDRLVAITQQSRTPMQAFYFETGIGQSACREAPNALLVQGPERFGIDITANGADIHVGSTILLQTTAPDQMRLIVVAGESTLYANGDNPVTLSEGQVTYSCLSDEQNLGIDGAPDDREVTPGCEWTPPRSLTDSERDDLNFVLNLPPVLNYTIDSLPEPEPCKPRDDWRFRYMVQIGDTLSGIARLFNLRTATLAEANCIEDPSLIYAGQELRVPTEPPAPTALPPLPQPTLPPATQQPGQAPPPPPSPTPTATPTPRPLTPSSITILAGNSQTASVGATFAANLQVQVLDGSQNPLPGANVTFTAPAGAPSGSFASTQTNTETVVTDGRGMATASAFTAGPCPTGSYSVTASAGRAAPASFSLTNALIVTNLNDSGAGSLRQAIASACAGDTITFGVSGTIALTSGELAVGQNLTISGPGAGALTISGSNASRVFSTSANVTMSGLTIANGNASGNGGGIANSGSLTLSGVTITNSTASVAGGGIANSGTLNISGSTVSNNSAVTGGGGGIVTWGPANVTNTTISGNSASDNGGMVLGAAGPVTISGSTISNNTGGQTGGFNSGGGVATVTNSTVSSNAGIGLFAGKGGSLAVQGTTTSNNNPTNCGGFPAFFIDNGGNTSGDGSCPWG